MKTSFKVVKIFSLILGMLMVFMLFTGCQGKGGEKDTNETAKNAGINGTTQEVANTGVDGQNTDDDGPGWKKDTSPVTFDWYINLAWFPGKWGMDMVSKYVTEKTGVNINYIIPAGNENEKLNTLIASNSLPDFITLAWQEAAVRQMQENGLVLPINQLADQYDPYFYEVASESILKWYTQEDGNVYGYPGFAYAPERLTPDVQVQVNGNLLVRKDMYEAIGKPDMRTPEGFLTALKEAKEKYPIALNGQPLIPIGFEEFTSKGCYSFGDIKGSLLSYFLAIPYEKDGKLYDYKTDPEYIRWMKTFRKANEMGLISKDVFIDKQAQIDEKLGQGMYFAKFSNGIGKAQSFLAQKDPNTAFIAVDGIANQNMDQPKLDAGSIAGWLLNMIPTNNKNPERAIKFLSYMLSEEGQHDMYLGVEGEMWETVNGKDQLTQEAYELLIMDKPAFVKKYGGETAAHFMLSDPIMIGKWAIEAAEPFKQIYEWGYGKGISYAPIFGIEPLANSQEGIYAQKIDDKWGLILPKLILAKSDEEFDKLYNEFLEYRESQGYEKLMAYKQKKFEENKKKLGLK